MKSIEQLQRDALVDHMQVRGKYEHVAELAFLSLIARDSEMSPPDAWDEAARRVFPHSEASQKKGCPRGAFLGLAAAGLLRDVPQGDYGRSSGGKNAEYAKTAARLIRADQSLVSRGAEALWAMTLEKLGAERGKKSNSQMKVVLKLHSMGVLL